MPHAAEPGPLSDTQLHALRAFNRFYTRWLGLLDEHLPASRFTLSETRVLYELAQRDAGAGWSATELARELGLDGGYLSRLLERLRTQGLVLQQPAAGDARRKRLSLSAAGRRALVPLQRASVRQLQQQQQLAHLQPAQASELVAATQRVMALLQPEPEPAPVPVPAAAARRAAPVRPVLLRPPHSGDLGWVIRRQAQLYQQEYGWGLAFEGLVADVLGRFVREFQPTHEACWIAECEGQIVGSIFCVRQSARVAKLRLLYVEPSTRGQGIGRTLVRECIGFARSKGYRQMVLWTNACLHAARRIYETEGFVLVKEEPHRSFGAEEIGQTWALRL